MERIDGTAVALGRIQKRTNESRSVTIFRMRPGAAAVPLISAASEHAAIS